MPASAFVLALGSALLHAGWNAFAADADDPQAMTAAAVLAALALFAIPAALTWRVEAEALPYLAASTCVHGSYLLLLTAAYRRAELSLAYPLARGIAPPLVLLLAVVFTGADASAWQVAGVVAVGAGALLVRGAADGDALGVALALATGVAIAAYTILDKQGLEYASPLAYLELLLIGPCVMLVAVFGRGGRLRAHMDLRAVGQGSAMLGSYGLILVALTMAPAAPVAAVRESSVVFAVAIGALILHEQVGPRRAAGAAVVTLGLAAVSLG